ncbi:MAG TPA: sensor histidine kinase [Thermoanaerobaculia bacterium]
MRFRRLSIPRQLPLRWHLLLLALGALLPLVVFAAVVVPRLSRQERAAVERRLMNSARLMATGVDREISGSIRALRVLAESERLDRGDLEGFHAEAERVRRTQPSWLSVLLLSPDGRQLLSSSAPWGTPLSQANEPASLREVVRTRQPVAGNLARGQLRQRWAFAVRVPMVRDGEVRYVLTAAVMPEALSGIVSGELPSREEWTRAVVDRAGVVVARAQDPERFVGRSGTPSFLRQIREAREAVYRDVTIDGAAVYVAFHRAPLSGWTAAVAAPVEALEGPGRRSLLAMIWLGLALLILSGTGAFLLSRRVSREIASASAAAEALAHGGRPRVEPSAVTEVARLGEALERSADLLSRRERERDEHLARAEAARAEAEAANRAKDDFLAMLGHELRNPLSPIVTTLEILKHRDQVPARELGILGRQVQHLTRLVDDLLDVSRITRGKVELRKEPVELSAVVAKGVEMASPLLDQRRHRLTVEVPQAALQVHGDPARLAQVLANLLTNAAKYTEPGGDIRVQGRREGGEAVLAVTDDGHGMTADLLPRVFDLFVQGPRSLARQEGGLGIGLTLVRNLVAMHGGKVEARSDGPGRGSTFLVKLPLHGEAAPSPLGARPELHSVRG